MNFEELEDMWKETDRDLDKNIHINQTKINHKTMKKIRSNLTETRWESVIELVLNIPFFYFLKEFCFNHMLEPKFLIPGLFLFLLSVSAIIFCAYKLFVISRINSKFPIIQTQRNLASIEYLTRLEINALFFLIPTFSLAFLIVVARGLLYIDLYHIAGSLMIPYFASCFVVGLIIVILLKVYPDKKLAKAVQFLKDLKEV